MSILANKTGYLYRYVMPMTVVVLSILLSSTQAQSSACCPDPGTWNKPKTVPKEKILTLIHSLKFPEIVYVVTPEKPTSLPKIGTLEAIKWYNFNQ